MENSDSTPQTGSPNSVAGSTKAAGDLALRQDKESGPSGDGGECLCCLSFLLGGYTWRQIWRKFSVLRRDPWPFSLYYRQSFRNLRQRYLAVQGIGRMVKIRNTIFRMFSFISTTDKRCKLHTAYIPGTLCSIFIFPSAIIWHGPVSFKMQLGLKPIPTTKVSSESIALQVDLLELSAMTWATAE